MRTWIALLAWTMLGACGEDAVDAPGEETVEVAAAEAEEPAPAEAAPASPPPETPRPYEEGVDAQAQIDRAVAAARADGKRVLLMFGANWCVWCRRLDYVFQNDARVSSELSSRYHLVHVDVGARESDTNRAVAARYGDPIRQGLPCLVVLDADGGVEHVQETGSLEQGDRHDPARVLAFLERWRRS